MVRDTAEAPLRVLFLDPDVMLDAAKVTAGWAAPEAKPDGDPAKDVFVRAIDTSAISRLNAVLDAVPDLTVVLATQWSLLWTTTDIVQMLHEAGYKGTKFSTVNRELVRQQRETPATMHVTRWLRLVEGCDIVIGGYAVWADECPTEHLTHLAVGVPRTVSLLKSEVS